MIFIEKKGRFGNFLFQFFLAKYIQKNTKKKIIVFSKNENNFKFNSKNNIDTILNGYFSLPKYSFFLELWKKNCFYIDDNNFNNILESKTLSKEKTYYINGFFQNIDFINDNNEILENLLDKNKIISNSKFFDTDLTIHIRHLHKEFGNIDNHLDYQEQPNSNFYTDIIKDLNPQKIKVICSDPKNSTLLELKDLYKNRIFYESNDDIYDFFNIIYSKNLILSNSTFCLWGSLLSNAKNIFIPNMGVLKKILNKKKINTQSNIIYI